MIELTKMKMSKRILIKNRKDLPLCKKIEEMFATSNTPRITISAILIAYY